MKRVLSPISLVSAACTFVLLALWSAAAGLVVPQLLELLRTEPRLAMLGFLGLAVAPGGVVVLIHHVGHRALDGIDAAAPARGVLPGVESWWAGALAWLVLYGTSVMTSLVLLVVEPPKIEPEIAIATIVRDLAEATSLAHAASLHSFVWIGIATAIYELERRSRRR